MLFFRFLQCLMLSFSIFTNACDMVSVSVERSESSPWSRSTEPVGLTTPYSSACDNYTDSIHLCLWYNSTNIIAFSHTSELLSHLIVEENENINICDYLTVRMEFSHISATTSLSVIKILVLDNFVVVIVAI